LQGRLRRVGNRALTLVDLGVQRVIQVDILNRNVAGGVQDPVAEVGLEAGAEVAADQLVGAAGKAQ
jgi:hypothetical protein